MLHFSEQLRQLEEISDPSEYFPPHIKLQLLQNAVRPINDLRIVETLDEFQSITTVYGRSSSLKYQTYYDLLINACVRYDRTKKSNIANRGDIYQTSSNPNNDGFNNESPYESPGRDPYMGIDTPSYEFYNINTTQYGPPRQKLQPSLPRPNQGPSTFLKKKLNRNRLVLSTCQDIYILFSAKRPKILYRNRSIMLRPFKSLSLHEISMKLILYMIYMKIHKTILHHPMKMMNSKIAKNSILIKI